MTHTINKICLSLGRIEGQTVTLHKALKNLNNNLKDIQLRVQALEKQQSLWRGGIGMMLSLATLIGTTVHLLVMIWIK